MATRKPLVVVSGTVRELGTGDTITGVGVFPFYTSANVYDPIRLTSDFKLPFFLASGSASDIPTVT